MLPQLGGALSHIHNSALSGVLSSTSKIKGNGPGMVAVASQDFNLSTREVGAG